MSDSSQKGITRYFVLAGILWLLCGAGIEFFNISWGTGDWLGRFSPKWFFVFLVFVVVGIRYIHVEVLQAGCEVAARIKFMTG